MRIAVLGANGQLGADLVGAARAKNLEVAVLSRPSVDVTRRETLAAAFDASRPDVVINCASATHVDGCEDAPGDAFRVNALGALNVARAAREAGARVVYVSTDYVFDGAKPPMPASAHDQAVSSNHGYVEADATAPLNVYGSSKLAGEHLTLQAADDAAMVCRVSSLYGVQGARGKGGNFIETILAKAKQGDPLKVVSDQWMTPTYTRDAAEAILELALQDECPGGVVHVTNPFACTWHAFAAKAVELSGLDAEVGPVPASTWPAKARRPRNSALCTDRLRSLRVRRLPAWPEALGAYLEAKGHLP